jgi:hypothetical protein
MRHAGSRLHPDISLLKNQAWRRGLQARFAASQARRGKPECR